MDVRELVAAAAPRVGEFSELRDLGLIARHGHFFPCGIHYPPITMYPHTEPEEFLKTYEPPEDDAFVIYVHIPFCNRRCTFCHYPVVTGASESDKDSYLDLIAREMDIWRDMLGIDRFKAQSVLIAGGTPTFLEPRKFKRFHEEFAKRVDMTSCTQVGYDVHPEDLVGDAGRERLRIMRDFGSDRVTMGLQSLDDAVLKHMNRGHTAADAYKAIDEMRGAGFSDICIEFIFGYPGLTMDTWVETLRRAASTEVEEIQLYRLKITPYGDSPAPVEKIWQRHPERFPEAEDCVRQKQVAHTFLAQQGYFENLTRVFTRKPEHVSHYAADQCCRQLDCLGWGQSAFSSLRDRFSIHTADLDEYAARILAGRLPLNRGLVRNWEDAARWHFVLPLKNSQMDKAFYRARMGIGAEELFRAQLDALAAYDLVTEDEEAIRLTEKGRFYADEVCAQFHDPQYLPFPADHYADGPLKMASPLNISPERRRDLQVRSVAAPPCSLRQRERAWPGTAEASLPVSK